MIKPKFIDLTIIDRSINAAISKVLSDTILLGDLFFVDLCIRLKLCLFYQRLVRFSKILSCTNVISK